MIVFVLTRGGAGISVQGPIEEKMVKHSARAVP